MHDTHQEDKAFATVYCHLVTLNHTLPEQLSRMLWYHPNEGVW